MPQSLSSEFAVMPVSVHQFYMNVLNEVSDIIYWVDQDCQLKGCNQAFMRWLGIPLQKDLKDSPYYLMEKYSAWDSERINAFRLDDMRAIFSNQSQTDVLEPPVYDVAGQAQYLKAKRILLTGADKQITGLLVVLKDISQEQLLQNQLQAQLLAEKQPGPFQRSQRKAAPRILMVEDNLIAQKIEQELLTSLGCKVDLADSGDAAVALFVPGKYDLVLMDISLQDTSGYLVAKKLRQIEADSGEHVTIIALTSYQAEVIKEDCRDYLMDGVLTKPLTAEQAEQMIQHFVYCEDTPILGLERIMPQLGL